MKKRKIPMRKCIACHNQEEKKNLFRIVRTPEGEVILDLKGKKNGRGAYLSKDKECIEKARQKGLLSKQLKAEIPDTLYENLLTHVQGSGESHEK